MLFINLLASLLEFVILFLDKKFKKLIPCLTSNDFIFISGRFELKPVPSKVSLAVNSAFLDAFSPCKIFVASIAKIILSLLISSVAIARSTGCKEGNCENGFGKWVYTDKTTYEGEWVGTKKNGQGVETWPNGYIYKGEFKNSEWSGVGVLTFPDGSTYEGEWAKGFMNGKGTFTWSDGTQKTGTWKNGKLQD